MTYYKGYQKQQLKPRLHSSESGIPELFKILLVVLFLFYFLMKILIHVEQILHSER